ncbi:MAG: hypothetical protein WKG32_14535 [Gemmatimonadaceae bacterium]
MTAPAPAPATAPSATPTPYVDEVLRDPLAVPPGVSAWLRDIESRARALHARVFDTHGRTLPIPVLEEAARGIEHFLHDRTSGALHRTLRRPLGQLAPGTPASSSFGKYAHGLFERVEEALAVQAAADVLRRSIDELRERYAPRLPNLAEGTLRDARLTDDGVAKAHRVRDLERMTRRLQWANDRLERLLAELPPGAAPPLAPGHPLARAAGTPTLDELRAALSLRLEQRRNVTNSAGVAAELRRLAARHRDALRRAAGPEVHAEPATYLVAAEHLASVAALPDAPVAGQYDAVMLWFGLLHEARGAVNTAISGPAWRPVPTDTVSTSPSDADDRELDDDDLIDFVVPIDDRYALITKRIRSAVRVWTWGAAREGASVRVRAFGEASTWQSAALAQLDVAPCFGSLSPAEPAWYRSQRDAVLSLVEPDGEDWFARIDSPGTLVRLDVPAWKERCGSPGALRVLEEPHNVVPGTTLWVGPAPGYTQSFLGFRTQTVRTPLMGHPVAWLRSGEATTSAAEVALEREHALFVRVAESSAGIALQPLGGGRIEESSTSGFLYARPLALRPEQSPPLADWLTRNQAVAIDCLRSVARVLVAVRDAGFSLGQCHPDMFAFGMDWSDTTRPPRPVAVLVSAPFAARLGTRFIAAASPGKLDGLQYPKVRFRGAVPAVLQGHAATPEVDAQAFGILALDVLAKQPIVEGSTWFIWELLPDFVIAKAAQVYSQPTIASAIAESMKDPSKVGRVWAWMESLAASAALSQRS